MKYFILIFFLTISNCESKKKGVSDSELMNILNTNIIKYHETQNKKFLDTAYVKLNQNTNYKKFELTNPNLQLSISLLLNMKKYDELKKLLESTKYLNEYNRITILNTVKYLIFKDTDRRKANSFIKNNIKIINDSLNKKPKDSLLYADYFSMRMYLIGKKNTIKEIDSMQASSQEYTQSLYRILKESIENYPNEK